MLYGEGISHINEVIDLGVAQEIIDKSGAWFAYKEEKIGQGKEAVRAYLQKNPVICAEIEKQIKERLFAPPMEETGEKEIEIEV